MATLGAWPPILPNQAPGGEGWLRHSWGGGGLGAGAKRSHEKRVGLDRGRQTWWKREERNSLQQLWKHRLQAHQLPQGQRTKASFLSIPRSSAGGWSALLKPTPPHDRSHI